MSLTVFALIIIALIDLKPLYKQQSKRHFFVAGTVFVIVGTLCLILSAGVVLPSPLVALGKLIESIGLAYPPLS